ncbi:helix-turn-helix domain-containing protein [Mannheimia granulomatis]|uniref:helix-turn-helix domain-containing protein n=1 Tax=Mannheimia granulomatis TaxID=85402 RepID=UPI00047BF930|nr:helix-turn-helix domain-containing protein [Mannheimia granulomatis]QLB19240.1 transposase [Mannheimia granulomatis]
MGKHYSTEFKLHVIQQVLNHQMGVREVAQHFSISTHSSVVMWLQRFEKYGINGLLRQPNKKKSNMPKSLFDGSKKVKNPNDVNELLKRIEYLEAENACLKKLKELDEKKLRRKKDIS